MEHNFIAVRNCSHSMFIGMTIMLHYVSFFQLPFLA